MQPAQPQGYRAWIAQSDPSNAWALNYVGNDYSNGAGGSGLSASDAKSAQLTGGFGMMPDAEASAAKQSNAYNGVMALANQYQTYLNGFGSNNTGNTGGTGAAKPDLSSYDQAIGTYNNSINRLPGQLDVAKNNINQGYNDSMQGINTNMANATGSYNNSTTQNGQALRNNKNTIADQQSTGLRGLMRMLGSYGASGSSSAQDAGQATAQQANLQRAGAGQTFATNQSGLDTNWGTFNTQDKQNRNNLESWKTNQMNSAQSQSDSTKQDLLTKLAGLQGQRSQAAGGSYTASAQPYIDQAQALNSSIDNLGRLAPTYTGAAANYTARPLDSYQNQGVNGAKVNQGQGQGSDNPYLAMLLGLDKKQTNGYGA